MFAKFVAATLTALLAAPAVAEHIRVSIIEGRYCYPVDFLLLLLSNVDLLAAIASSVANRPIGTISLIQFCFSFSRGAN